MSEFLYPYTQLLILATRELLQLYETFIRGSVGVYAANSLSEHLGLAALMLLALIILGIVSSVFSIYKRKRLTGVICYLVIMAIPGLWALYDIQLFVLLLDKPSRFTVGGSPYSNDVGDVHGLIPLLAILMYFGWSLFLLFQTIYSATKVKALIDHLWYPSGVVLAAIFILSQSKETEAWAKHKKMEQLYAERAEFLLGQNRVAFEYLRSSGKFAKLSNDQKGLLIEYLKRSKYFFRINGTKVNFVSFDGVSDMFFDYWPDVKQTLDTINQNECEKDTWAMHCHYWNMKDWELTRSKLDPFGEPVLFPYQYFDIMSDLSHKVNKSVEEFRNKPPIRSARLLVFCLLAVLAGAKIFTASVTFLPVSERKEKRFRLLVSLFFILLLISSFFTKIKQNS